ncbi:hypothetical protein OK016_00535 [Vibrio chagasii]|nr:hypothetical protein [Vibrio chagasii]
MLAGSDLELLLHHGGDVDHDVELYLNNKRMLPTAVVTFIAGEVVRRCRVSDSAMR